MVDFQRTVVLTLALALIGCSERNASKLLQEAKNSNSQTDYSTALADIQKLLDQYPTTNSAPEAKSLLNLYSRQNDLVGQFSHVNDNTTLQDAFKLFGKPDLKTELVILNATFGATGEFGKHVGWIYYWGVDSIPSGHAAVRLVFIGDVLRVYSWGISFHVDREDGEYTTSNATYAELGDELGAQGHLYWDPN
jgi:hypothetical protein